MVDRIRELLAARQLSPTQFADTIGVARPIISHILGGRNKPSLEVVQKIIAAFPDLSLPWLLNGAGSMFAAAEEQQSSGSAVPRAAAKAQGYGAQHTPPDATAAPTANAAPKSGRKPSSRSGLTQPADFGSRASLAATDLGQPSHPPFAAPGMDVGVHPGASGTPIAGSSAASESEVAPNTSPATTPSLSSSSPEAISSGASTGVVYRSTVASQAANEAGGAPSSQPTARPGKAIQRIVIFYQDGSFAEFRPEHS
ncbi:helix-turn-helix domain-containing protein [Hymenobacter weizhouensis]|uniref:helix-turn-helix domain-containing protein n=1 Tax=Hymenobacter sp. YIM 151500-1 TaxID=2987689 RepID=UPI0039B6FD2A